MAGVFLFLIDEVKSLRLYASILNTYLHLLILMCKNMNMNKRLTFFSNEMIKMYAYTT